MWVDWNALTRDSIAAETGAAPPISGVDPARLARLRAEAEERGKRVGEMVTSGDCAGGERVAREAGDFALARAARTYCAATPR